MRRTRDHDWDFLWDFVSRLEGFYRKHWALMWMLTAISAVAFLTGDFIIRAIWGR
jgi:hypothetical protein